MLYCENPKACEMENDIEISIKEGGFGKVYIYKDFVKKMEIIQRTSLNERNIYNNIITEKNILFWENKKNISLGLPRIIDISETVVENIDIQCITMPNYGISLKEYLKIKKIDDLKIQNIYLNLLNSLEFLHSNKIIHNDLKLSNIIIDINNDNNITLIDFGLSSFNNEYFENFIGNTLFSSINSHKSVSLTYVDDIQSLAFIILYLYNKKLPWSYLIKKNDKLHIYNSKVKFKNNYNIYFSYIKNFWVKYLFDYIFSLYKYNQIDYFILHNLILKN